MGKIRELLGKLRGKKGLTGADVAGAITIIVMGVGIATSVYVNSVNKSRDNMRYSNAVRILTSVMESIQRKPYEYVTALCDEGTSRDTYTFKGSNTGDKRPFETKIPNGYELTVVAKRNTSPDIVRDVIVKVKYKSSKTYKTITAKTIKERELLDMGNSPDLSLIPDYNPIDNTKYYYPVKESGNEYIITTSDDVDWYDYNESKFPVICVTNSGELSVGDKVPSGSKYYLWIPRYSYNDIGAKKDISNIMFLYGSSDYGITWHTYDGVSGYGLYYEGAFKENSKPVTYRNYNDMNTNNNYKLGKGFSSGDGLSGIWYDLEEENGGSDLNRTVKEGLENLNIKVIPEKFDNKN